MRFYKKYYFYVWCLLFYPLWLFAQPLPLEFSQEFHLLPKGEERKKQFMGMLLPIIEAENKQILNERQIVLEFFDQFLEHATQKLQSKQYIKLAQIAKRYRINRLLDRDEYLHRIDIIPPSLAIAQSALESGWGTSDYSRRYNNFFGEYTMRSHVPSKKIKGHKRRIRIFDSITQAVTAYMWNLNTHYTYTHFREQRYLAHKIGKEYNGLEALRFLLAYSEIGEIYAQKVARLIHENSLNGLDSSFFQKEHSYFVISKQEQLKTLLPIQPQESPMPLSSDIPN